MRLPVDDEALDAGDVGRHVDVASGQRTCLGVVEITRERAALEGVPRPPVRGQQHEHDDGDGRRNACCPPGGQPTLARPGRTARECRASRPTWSNPHGGILTPTATDRYALAFVIETPAQARLSAGEPGSTAVPPTDDRRWVDRHPAWTIVIATLVVGLPLIAAVIALRAERWFPVLDLAMTEFRVRDVFTADNPLIGLPGRIGEYPDQGSHPGPLSFYLLAPTYRILGSSSWALEAATVVIHLAAIATALWIGQRRLGWKGVAAVAALLALAIRGYGQVLLTQPWNPYLPLLAWLLVLLATWAVLCGDHRMLIPLVVAATLCAQTHVPYLPLGAGMTVLRWSPRSSDCAGAPSDERPAVRRSLVWSVGIGVVLWIPPLLDQLTNEPGNIRELADHFGSPPEPAIGLGDGLRIMARHLDAWYGLGAQLIGHRALRRRGLRPGVAPSRSSSGSSPPSSPSGSARELCEPCTSSSAWPCCSAPRRRRGSSDVHGST